MPHYKRLLGEKCYLSPCAAEDAARWAEWFNDPAVTIPLGDEAYTLTSLEAEQAALAQALQHPGHLFTIVDLATEAAIGRCMLFNVNLVDRHAMLGIAIGEKAYRGKGYGLEAIRLLLDYAFNLLNLHNVMLGVFEFNQAAIRCYEKAGFRLIGRRRQCRLIAGRRYDEVMMDILATEFISPGAVKI